MLSVVWGNDAGTRDIDLEADNHYKLALPRPRAPINLCQVILDIRVLIDNCPGDITLAFEAARSQGDEFVSDFMTGLHLIDKEVLGAVLDQIDGNTF